MKKLLTLTFAPLALVATSNAQTETTLFSTDFTEASFAAAGLSTTSVQDGSWVLDDVNDLATTALGASPGNQRRAHLYTTSTYSDSDNLTLEVDFIQTVTGTGFSIGLVETGASFTSFGPIDFDGGYGLMFITDGVNQTGGDGDFVFSDGSSYTTLADGTQTYNRGSATSLRFSINSDGDWTYSLDGATATTGTIAGGSFDLSKSYQPYVYVRRQNANTNASSIYSMALSTAIPEPSSFALLSGLLGLTWVMIRRRG